MTFGGAPYAGYPYGYAPLGETVAARAMPGARKRTAIAAELTQGVTPASPAFMIVRDISVANDVQRGDAISRERRPDRAAASLVKGLDTFQKTVELPYVRDAGTDLLWQSVLCSTFSADVLKHGSARQAFTLEETYDAADGAYRRIAGCVVDELALVLPSNDIGRMRFKLRGVSEVAGPDPLPGATYAAPTPGYDPVTGADIQVGNLFSITRPRVVSVSLAISNSTADRHAFGSTEPFGTGLGALQVVGQVELYFTRLDEYKVFMRRQRGRGFDITIGQQSGAKDRLRVFNADVFNPGVDDPGAGADHKVTLHFVAKHSAADGGVLSLTRNVA